MKIKPMLARLQNAIGRDDLMEQMVLLPEPKKNFFEKPETAISVNLIVGYNASPKSHTALDIAFWIAYQTRLATNAQVTVHAVYVEENRVNYRYLDRGDFGGNKYQLECAVRNISKPITRVLTQPQIKLADRILLQAKNLAREWQGSFKSHLCFGVISGELRKIVESETADILLLGCRSKHSPLIHGLGDDFPCAVLGIPKCIDE